MRCGISTHLYHEQRLTRDHLIEIAASGFEAIELFATRSHFDYHDPEAVGQLEMWLRETGVRLHSVHAPITESFSQGKWGKSFSTASTDASEREYAVRETEAALRVANRMGAGFVVVHLGLPQEQGPRPADNNRDAARRSLEQVHAAAVGLGVRIALEVIPNDLSTPSSLVRLLEEEAETPDAGICLDFGHAFLLGDVIDGVEVVSEHLITTHVHDNHGRSDDHLAPFDGSIDWAAALMAVQKIGYEGLLLMELGNTATPAIVLDKAKLACARFEQSWQTGGGLEFKQ